MGNIGSNDMIICCMTETTIGIIIGSLFTLLGVIVNGVITFVMSRNAHDREVEEHKRCEQKKDADELRVKRERAYRDFSNCFGFMNMLIGLMYSTKGNQVNISVFGELFSEKLKENIAKAAEVISEISLCGSGAVVDKCGKYMKLWNSALQNFNSISQEDCVNLDQELMSVVNEMKKELGFDSL